MNTMQSIRRVGTYSLYGPALLTIVSLVISNIYASKHLFAFDLCRINKSFLLMVFISANFFSSCNMASSSAPKPAIILSEEQMTVILMDVHLVEGTINFKRNIGQGHDEQKSELYHQLMENHGITPEILESNLMYYNQKPAVMEKIYEDVISRLTDMQTEIKVEIEN
ncbi:MAG: DUF4296 domain-containing protein [Bacteroidales bacterium]|nr:DUF4296 domain-containing protein [Bacteroidales bacterium]MDP2236665.1 DUF4296 domain-containing protein [Bacteroidales bacterium]